MIRNYDVQTEQCKVRISQKTLDHTFLSLIEKGAKCPPFVSNAILNTARNVFCLNEANGLDTLKTGQMKIVGLAAHEPAGKPISQCEKKTCVVTIFLGDEDHQTRAIHGISGLRRAKLLRIATESWEQGVLLTHEDFAYQILHCGLRTIARDIKYFKEHDIIIPTRGQQLDIGRGTSHKIKAVEYLITKRKNEHEIAKILYHSIHAIERYTLCFARVVLLKEKGIAVNDIAFIVQISAQLATEYLDLYEKYKNDSDYKEQLQQIIGQAQNFDVSDDLKKNERS